MTQVKIMRSAPAHVLASALVLGALVGAPTVARADEGGVSFWLPGLFGSLGRFHSSRGGHLLASIITPQYRPAPICPGAKHHRQIPVEPYLPTSAQTRCHGRSRR